MDKLHFIYLFDLFRFSGTARTPGSTRKHQEAQTQTAIATVIHSYRLQAKLRDVSLLLIQIASNPPTFPVSSDGDRKTLRQSAAVCLKLDLLQPGTSKPRLFNSSTCSRRAALALNYDLSPPTGSNTPT